MHFSHTHTHTPKKIHTLNGHGRVEAGGYEYGVLQLLRWPRGVTSDRSYSLDSLARLLTVHLVSSPPPLLPIRPSAHEASNGAAKKRKLKVYYFSTIQVKRNSATADVKLGWGFTSSRKYSEAAFAMSQLDMANVILSRKGETELEAPCQGENL